MKSLRKNLGNILLCLFEIEVGVLLLVNPTSFTAGIIVACGAVLIIFGVLRVYRYFHMDPVAAARTQSLWTGLVMLLGGAFCAFRYQWLIAVFPIISVFYGVLFLIVGLGKVQLSVDMLRLRKRRWFLAAISAGVTILCAVIVILNPFATVAALWMFAGITMIAEAVFDLITMLMNRTRKEENV